MMWQVLGSVANANIFRVVFLWTLVYQESVSQYDRLTEQMQFACNKTCDVTQSKQHIFCNMLNVFKVTLPLFFRQFSFMFLSWLYQQRRAHTELPSAIFCFCLTSLNIHYNHFCVRGAPTSLLLQTEKVTQWLNEVLVNWQHKKAHVATLTYTFHLEGHL